MKLRHNFFVYKNKYIGELKNKLFIQTILLFLFFNIQAQKFIISEADTINYIDTQNLKQGFWQNVSARNEGVYVDGEKNGIWRSYYKNGNIKSEITYVNGVKRGYAKIFYEDGQIAEEGTWMEDKWTGKYKSYYKNGKLSYVWNYNEEGDRCGYQKYYYDNGNIKIEGEWAEGKETGTIKEYYPSGFLKSKKVFCEGKCDKDFICIFHEKDSIIENEDLNKTNIFVADVKEDVTVTDSIKVFSGSGNHILYNKDRNPEKEGEFVNGILINGKHYFYTKDKTLLKTAIYKSGKIVEIINN